MFPFVFNQFILSHYVLFGSFRLFPAGPHHAMRLRVVRLHRFPADRMRLMMRSRRFIPGEILPEGNRREARCWPAARAGCKGPEDVARGGSG